MSPSEALLLRGWHNQFSPGCECTRDPLPTTNLSPRNSSGWLDEPYIPMAREGTQIAPLSAASVPGDVSPRVLGAVDVRGACAGNSGRWLVLSRRLVTCRVFDRVTSVTGRRVQKTTFAIKIHLETAYPQIRHASAARWRRV